MLDAFGVDMRQRHKHKKEHYATKLRSAILNDEFRQVPKGSIGDKAPEASATAKKTHSRSKSDASEFVIFEISAFYSSYSHCSIVYVI